MLLTTAARRHLLTNDTITGFVGRKVWKENVLEPIQGTAGRALIVNEEGSWSTGMQMNTQMFPVLRLTAIADADRYDDGTMKVDNATDKAHAVLMEAVRFMAPIQDQWWGAGGSNPGLKVITSVIWQTGIKDRPLNYSDEATREWPWSDCAAISARLALTIVEGKPSG